MFAHFHIFVIHLYLMLSSSADRMPLPIGNFISSAVYDGRLRSQHLITDSSSLAFVNVSAPQGLEERAGTSWRVVIFYLSPPTTVPATDIKVVLSESRRGANYGAPCADILQVDELLRHHAIRRPTRGDGDRTQKCRPPLGVCI